jgi:signal transduction histidine kinase
MIGPDPSGGQHSVTDSVPAAAAAAAAAAADGASLRSGDAVQSEIAAPGGQVDQTATRAGPWANSRFWVLQLVVLALYLIRLAVTVAFHLDITSLAVEFSTMALFLVPVVYAALNYGLQGSIITAGWVTLLAIPRFVSASGAHDYVAAWAELMQIVLLDALAYLIGQRVTAEREARLLAESAREAHLSAEALYRDLFDSNQAPILIIDGNGCVAEANASAERAFGAAVPANRTIGAGDRSPSDAVRLVDLIGPQAAAYVLARLLSAPTPSAHGHEDDLPEDERVEPVPFEVDGRSVLFRPTATTLGGSDADRRMQVVFEDVTAETRRHDLMEAYAARVVLGQEEERRHIAQELHDGPLQTLIHLCRQIDSVEAAAAEGRQGALALSDLRVIVEDSVAELRSIARGLRPSILDDLGLMASINQLLTEAAEREQFESAFAVTGSARRLSPTVELAIFRIAQEALSNVERHAAAERVAIDLQFESGGLRLSVKDDGVGFDTSNHSAGGSGQGLGLSGMNERAHLIGSRLVVHSGEGTGTTVEIWVPATVLDRT